MIWCVRRHVAARYGEVAMPLGHFRCITTAGAFLLSCSHLTTLNAQNSAEKITVSSPAFKDGQPIPEEYTAYGKGQSIPLSWSNLPSGTRSVAVIMDDPDARTPRPFVHWVIYNIPADTKSLDPALPTKPTLDSPHGARQGSTSTGAIGYFGPKPPKGGPHHYHIKVFALDQQLKLDAGADEPQLTKAMEGHILGQGELVGTVQKQ
jgi:Raf kinase inhibitor-like YbhB/YbcL family protein